MCLTIDNRFHSSYKKPIIADKNYITYKALLRHPLTMKLITPYQEQPILFDDKGVDKKPKVNFHYHLYDGNSETNSTVIALISRGYHSFVRFGKRQAKGLFCSSISIIVPAIIPKGTKFFIGEDGDTVSNDIIYVKDEETLKKHYPDATYLSKVYKNFERKK